MHNSVIIASIDLQRAFDSLSHAKLIHKLTSYGISGDLLFCLQSFLTNRTQCVRIGQSLSSSCSVSSGVPRGSVTGALLFIIFINDISDHFDPAITTKLFADNLKIYADIAFHSDTTSFQHHLNLIYSWSLTWQLNIAFSKCKTMQLGAHFVPPHIPPLHIADQLLTSTTSLTDLGIKFDNNLKFNDCIQDIANRAYLLNFPLFLFKDTNSLVRAYKTNVRLLLEYDSEVWSPSQIWHINSIEAVQRAFTK